MMSGKNMALHPPEGTHTLILLFEGQELIVIADVVGGGVMLTGEAEEDGTGREVIQITPDTSDNIQALIRAIEREGFFIMAIVQSDSE